MIGTFSLFINILPEAIYCCLQTCYVDVMLLLMDCVCILTFIVVTLLVVYTNSPLWSEAIFQCETESKGLTNFLV